MSEPFVGQIMLVPYNFAPKGWAFCTGSLLSIQQNTALFSLLGTYYGGDGKTTFGLPNLQGNMAIHQGSGPLGQFSAGQMGGSANVTLLTQQLPAHTHAQQAATGSATDSTPSNLAFAPGGSKTQHTPYYVAPPANVAMNQASLQAIGSSQPHSNLMPSLTLNYIIALLGIYPQRP